MKVKAVLRLLREDGWVDVARRGSHRQLKNPIKPGRVTVAGKLSDDLAHGTLKSILRQAGLKMSELAMRYAIVIEKAGDNYSAYVLDLLGCVATGSTIEETENALREAIEFHLEGYREDNLPIPKPSSRVDYVELAA